MTHITKNKKTSKTDSAVSPITRNSYISQKQLTELKNTVIKYWPSLQDLPHDRNSTSLYQYSKTFIRNNPTSSTQNRRDAFADIFAQEVEKILGKEVAESAQQQLKQNASIATAQHFTPISHPKTLNPTLQFALPYFFNTEKNAKNIIVLSCSEVSFDNSWFPRGIQFHTDKYADEPKINPIVFFPRKVRPLPVINHPSYNFEAVDKMKKQIDSYYSEKEISKNSYEKLINLINPIYSESEVLSLNNYTDQVTRTNYLLWKTFFASSAQAVPNLIFISQEQIVTKLLLEHHMKHETPIHTLLFNKSCWNLVDKYFNGTTCGFSYERNYGTYLFWGHPKTGKYRTQLWRKGNMLVSPDGSIQIELSPESIQEAIEQKILVPSSLLSLITLSCYYGLILAGGMDQTRYLTAMKDAYINLFKEFSGEKTVEDCFQTPTTDLIITRPTLAYIEASGDYRDPATGIDFCIYGNQITPEKIVQTAQDISIEDIFQRLLPNLYEEYCPPTEKKELLDSITERSIEKITELDKKIPPLAVIPPPFSQRALSKERGSFDERLLTSRVLQIFRIPKMSNG